MIGGPVGIWIKIHLIQSLLFKEKPQAVYMKQKLLCAIFFYQFMSYNLIASLKWKCSTFPFPHSNGAAPRGEFTVIYSYHVVKEC
jgi:hypothetical protein